MKDYKDIPVVISDRAFSKEDNNKIQFIFKDTLRQVKDFLRAKGVAVDNVSCYISAAAPVFPASMVISHAPTKTSYNVGDNFVKTGLKCTVTYSNGATKVIEASGLNADTTTALAATDVKWVISYTEAGKTLTAEQAITVTSGA